MKWVLIILALAYLLNPFDLLPDILVGAGWLDDLAVIGAVGYLLYRMGNLTRYCVSGRTPTRLRFGKPIVV